MASRSKLKDQLRMAWEKTLTVDYPRKLIHSERGLQHFFCKHLAEIFTEAGVARTRRLFIEPCLAADDGKLRSPDLLICHTQRIIGVVEFKFRPKSKASTTKDLGTLAWLASHPAGLKLSNKRYLGTGDDVVQAYALAEDALLCWAGVYHRSDIGQLNKDRRFHAMHAVTSPGAAPLLSFE